MKEKKTVLRIMNLYDREGIEEYLSAQAKKGWLVEKIGALGFRFHKHEPSDLRFSLVYYPGGSEYEAGPSEGELTFCDFCEHSGWKTAASNRKSLVFYTDKADAVPIQTDPALEIANISRIMLPFVLFDLLYLLYTVGHLLFFVLIQLIYPLTVYENNATLLSNLAFLIGILFCVADLGMYFSWLLKAKKTVRMGLSELPKGGGGSLMPLASLVIIIALGLDIFSFSGKFGQAFVYCFGFLLIVILTLLVIWLLKALKCSKRLNQILSTAFCILMSVLFCVVLILGIEEHFNSRHHKVSYVENGQTKTRVEDPVPLKIEDLFADAEENVYNVYLDHDRSSILLRNVRATEMFSFGRAGKLPDPRSLSYQVVTVKAPFLYSQCKAELFRSFSENYGKPEEEDPDFEKHVSVDASEWGANEAYQLYIYDEPQDNYILCYDRKIIKLRIGFNEEGKTLTPELKRVIREKLVEE